MLERREIPVARIKLVDEAQVKQFLVVEESALPHYLCVDIVDLCNHHVHQHCSEDHGESTE